MADTLTVACKIPNGLMLQIYVQEKITEPVMAGGHKDVMISRPDPSWRQKLNGPARAVGKDVTHQIVHGFGLTHGVDATKYAIWLEQNKDSVFIKKGLVFAATRPADAVEKAKDNRNEQTGMEPIDPNNLPPEFKRSISTATSA